MNIPHALFLWQEAYIRAVCETDDSVMMSRIYEARRSRSSIFTVLRLQVMSPAFCRTLIASVTVGLRVPSM